MKLNDIETIEGLATYAQKVWGVTTVDITGLGSQVMKAAFEEIEKVMQAFPVLSGKIAKISKSKIGAMSTTFFGALTFNPTVFYSVDEASDEGVDSMNGRIMYTPLTRPRFAEEGYAVYPPDRREEYTNPFTWETVKASPLGFIGIKPDAPQWAQDEYKEWLETHKQATRGMAMA